MPSGLSIIGFMTLLILGAAGGLTWDRHPPIGFHVHVLWWSPGFDLSDSLATKLTLAEKATEKAQEGLSLCNASLDVQNASMAQAARISALAMASTQDDLSRMKNENARLQAGAAKLSLYRPQGADACARWEDADRAVLGALLLEGPR